MAQLGKAVSIILKESNKASALYDDAAAFHAPTECIALIERGITRNFRIARRHACHVAGVRNLHQLRKAIIAVCPTWDRYNHHRLGIGAL